MNEHNQQSLLLGKIAAYTEILVKDPSSTIFVSLAETYRKMGMLEDARQIISKGLNVHSGFSPAYIVLARVLCQLEDFAGSNAAFEKALDSDAESLAALVGYARVQILLGENNRARELLLKARQLSPADPVINKLLLSLPEETEIVVEETSDLIEQNDQSEDASVALVSPTLADLYLSQGLTEKGLELYQQLSSQDPDDLTLRRKVKELETQIFAEKRTVVDESVALVNQQEDLSTDSDEVVVASADCPVEESAIEILNQWLVNIQQRRGNV